MRIAIDARYLTRAESGIGNYTLNLIKALLEEDKGLELVLISNSKTGRSYLQNPRVTDIYFPFPPVSPFTRRALGPLLRRLSFDVFHSPFDMVPRGLHTPLVVTLHDINWLVNPWYNSTNRLFRLVAGHYFRISLAAAMQEASRIVAVSYATQRAIIEYAPWHAAKLCVTHNGFDPTRVYPLDKDVAFRVLARLIPPGTPFVLTVGQGVPYKNHLNAVRGFMAAFEKRHDYRMILVRRLVGQDKALDALLRNPRVQERVLTLPYVTPEVLNALYNAARMVLHPSYYEGFGLPLLEAMAVGIPMVTSNISVMPEVAGAAALLVNPADAQAIAEALQRLEYDEALRERLIAEGYKRLQLFSWSQCAQATLDVYRALV
jgi:glycosyltransferase involved in cell wall biosynthesis